MFSQPPDEDHNNSKTLQNNPRRRRKKIFPHKNKQKGAKKNQFKKKNNRFATTMSSWAENFTNAATWQLKHQIAYWKSKATALEYENKILHDIIRKNVVKGVQPPLSVSQECSDVNSEPEVTVDYETEAYEEEADQDQEEEDTDLVVSEEFIQFLKDNAKFKEDARKERERLKAKYNDEKKTIEEMEAGPSEAPIDRQEELKSLYGESWQRISAIEMSLQSKFINSCDENKPQYWPNIPLNFNFS